METTPPPIVEQIVAPVAGVVGDVIEPLEPVVDQVVAPVLDIVGDVVQSLEPVVDQVVAQVLGIVGEVVQVLDPVVDHVVAPVPNIVGDVVQSLDPVVDQVVSPVLGIVGDVVQSLEPVVKQVVAPVAEIVGDMVQTIEPVVDQLIAPMADFTGDVVHLVEPVMQQVVAPVLNVAGDVVQVIEPGMEQMVTPVVDVVSDVVQPVVDQVAAPLEHLLGDPLTSLLGLGQGDAPPIVTTPIAAASGSVSLGGLHLDDLFSGGGYTEYGLALQSVISGAASLAPQSEATSPSAADDHMAASARADVDPAVALSLLYEAIRGERGSRYRDKVERKTRCSTVLYDRMHLDVTPAVRLLGNDKASLIFHHKHDDPKEPRLRLHANPFGFAQWFKSQTPADAAFGAFFEKRSLDYDRARFLMEKKADTKPVPDQLPAFRKSRAVIALQLIKRLRNLAYDRRHKNLRRPPSVLVAYYVGRHANQTRTLGDAGGLVDFGVNLMRLPPGNWSSQRHWHSHEDEFVYVLEGELTLIEDGGETVLRAGDCAAFAKGSGNGHHIINKSGAMAVYLEVGSRQPADVTTCSDIDMMSTNADGRFVHKDGTPYSES